MKFEVPGKTFLVGEYSVLLGGSALGLATQPGFEISFERNYNQQDSVSFHPESPAGLYLKKNSKSLMVSIKDPYPHGGFGRSTAEYWAAVVPDLIKTNKNFYEIFDEYKSLHMGSGIDLAFQYFGNVCLADPLLQLYQTFNWHFENLDFYILSTGFKVATHEHLKTLDLKSLHELPVLSNRITQIYAENKEFEFLSLMKQWCALLEKYQLTHPNSLEMKAQLESFESIKLAKPCGALGADVIIVFFAKTHKLSVKNYLTENNFQIQAHSSDLVTGVISQIERLKTEKPEDHRGSNVD